jgi:hypothetical protein
MFKGKLRHIELINLYAMSQLEFDNCSLISIAHINLYIKLDHIDHTLKTFTILQKYV